MYVAAPPNILSVLPKGVSIASNATVPTINNLLINMVLNEEAKIIRKCGFFKEMVLIRIKNQRITII